MPRNVSVSNADLKWLQKNHLNHSYSELAQRVGCCVDTLKRILVREGLQEFEGAKYQVRRDFEGKLGHVPVCLAATLKNALRIGFFAGHAERQWGMRTYEW